MATHTSDIGKHNLPTLLPVIVNNYDNEMHYVMA